MEEASDLHSYHTPATHTPVSSITIRFADLVLKSTTGLYEDLDGDTRIHLELISNGKVIHSTAPAITETPGIQWNLHDIVQVDGAIPSFTLSVISGGANGKNRQLAAIELVPTEFLGRSGSVALPLLSVDDDGPSLELSSSVSVVVFEIISSQRRTPDPSSPHPLPLEGNINSLLTTLQTMPLDTIYQSVLSDPDVGMDKPAILNGLAQGFLERHKARGDLMDLDKAVSALHDAVQLCPDGHPELAAHLNSYGTALYCRFEEIGNMSDVNDAISACKRSVQLTQNDSLSKPQHLNNLGVALRGSFDRFGHVSHLEDAISAYQDATRLIPDDHPNQHVFLDNLQSALVTRFENPSDHADIDKGISAYLDAIPLIPDGHHFKAASLYIFAKLLSRRFELLGHVADIDKTVDALEIAARLTPDSNLEKHAFMSTLGNSLLARFDRLYGRTDIDKVILAHQDALRLVPDEHQDKPTVLYNLGNSYTRRYKHFGDLADCDEGILAYQSALRRLPDSHPTKPNCFSNLAVLLTLRFDRGGDVADADKAISASRDAVRITPDGPERHICLSRLAHLLLLRSEPFGNLSVIDNAVSTHQDAIQAISDNHPFKPVCFHNLGISLQRRFVRLGDLADIDKAVLAHENSGRLTPDADPQKAGCMSNLGSSLFLRFERLQDRTDIDRAIQAHQTAAQLALEADPIKYGFLNNLGTSLLARFERYKDVADINKAISAFEDAIWLNLISSAARQACLINLGFSLRSRFQSLGNLSDIDRAILTLQDTLLLIPEDSPNRPGCLNNLGLSLHSRFECHRDLADIDNAILAFQDAVRLTPETHPNQNFILRNLGSSFHSRFQLSDDPADIELATTQCSRAALSPTGYPSDRIEAAILWANYAQMSGHSYSIDAERCLLDLIPRVAWIGMTMTQRYQQLALIGGVVRAAVAVAISYEDLQTAVEWFEQGRSIVWSQLQQLRHPIDELRAKDRALVEDIEQVARSLGQTSTRDIATDPVNTASLEQIAQHHRQLTSKWETLVESARALPEFGDFLRPKSFSQLTGAARSGPVVMINIHEGRCDALILMPDLNDVLHVPLENFSFSSAQELQRSLQRHLSHAGLGARLTKVDPLPGHEPVQFANILSQLWTDVIHPVLQGLAFCRPPTDELPRVWWCPSGPLAFLPIHAAGMYDITVPGSKLSDFVISSYVPTLTTLLHHATSVMPFKLLAVAQPNTPNASRLPNATQELIQIRKCAGELPIMSLEGVEATVERVISGMAECSWVHFACHGAQNTGDPTKSALLLEDGRLHLSRIIQHPLPHAQFAFLSACQTAAGDKKLSEEAAHLAAGMLLAGYSGVVATMWSIADDDAPTIAKAIYSELLKDKQPDYTRAAYGLHYATQRLREQVPLTSWVPFIHIGI